MQTGYSAKAKDTNEGLLQHTGLQLTVSEVLEASRILMGLSGWEDIIEYKQPETFELFLISHFQRLTKMIIPCHLNVCWLLS